MPDASRTSSSTKAVREAWPRACAVSVVGRVVVVSVVVKAVLSLCVVGEVVFVSVVGRVMSSAGL